MTMSAIAPDRLGSAAFRGAYGLSRAYVAGAMAKGIGSTDLVVRMGRAGLLGIFGAGGLRHEVVSAALRRCGDLLPPGAPFGVNFLHHVDRPDAEWSLARIAIEAKVPVIEASNFLDITPALAWLRLSGARRRPDGRIVTPRRILAKFSRPELARLFLAPIPPALVAQLRQDGQISVSEADLAPDLLLADDLCVEADSGGHTDRQSALAVFPEILRLRDRTMCRYGGAGGPEVPALGLGGGLGSPEAVAAAFALGADFVLTGSINQCTVEAGTSDLVKDMLAQAGVQDMAMAPASDMFEFGSQVQVLRKGTLFPARAGRLHELYRRLDGLHALDPVVREQLERQIFRRSLDAVWDETRAYYAREAPVLLDRIEADPKRRMAAVFRWYLVQSHRLAVAGTPDRRADFQIWCGPAMGAFNRWVEGTPLQDWRRRHVDDIAERLMQGAAVALGRLSSPSLEPMEPVR